MKSRIASALALGAAVAAVVVFTAGKGRHTALVAEAAKSHQTVGFIEASGFAVIALAVAVVVFTARTVAVRRARAKAQWVTRGRDWQPRYPEARRRRAGARR